MVQIEVVPRIRHLFHCLNPHNVSERTADRQVEPLQCKYYVSVQNVNCWQCLPLLACLANSVSIALPQHHGHVRVCPVVSMYHSVIVKS